jgi:SprT protein
VNVQPIDEHLQQKVISATQSCLELAAEIYKLEIPSIPVRFDLKGRAAGMYRVARGARCIRYNPYLFAKYFDENLSVTVPHEVAHYVTDMLFGAQNVRPHGEEWRKVMRSLGVDPRVTGQYDLVGVPVRRQRRFSYHCGCATHNLTAIRHNRVRCGKAMYLCKCCGSPLVHDG